MKLILTLILLMLVMGACSIQNEEGTKVAEHPELWIVTIDSCEYLRADAYGTHKTYTHKGNCNNPIHNILHQ